ncbi:MAG: signal peptidase I [Symbiobacteriaceae bacterium]|nr:signal peptidase I [Symbiobacteriaceae bacterium]
MDKEKNNLSEPGITEENPSLQQGDNPASMEEGDKENQEKSPGFSWRREILSFGREFIIALIISILVTQFVFIIPLVPTGSMIPTISVNERILVDKLTRRFSPIKRCDIVVFPCPDTPEELYVKRAIGMPGDKVEIYNDTVFINDIALEEPYLTVKTHGTFGPYYVPEGHIFVLGDNRNLSRDSRLWTTTPYVALTAVQGRGVAVMWPLSQIRWLH